MSRQNQQSLSIRLTSGPSSHTHKNRTHIGPSKSVQHRDPRQTAGPWEIQGFAGDLNDYHGVPVIWVLAAVIFFLVSHPILSPTISMESNRQTQCMLNSTAFNVENIMKIDAQLPLTPGLDGNVLIWQGVSLLHIGITALKIRYSRVLALIHLTGTLLYPLYKITRVRLKAFGTPLLGQRQNKGQIASTESNPAPYLSSSRIHWVFATHLINIVPTLIIPQNFEGTNRISSLHSSEVIEAAKHEIMGILVICAAQGESEGQIPATTEIGTCRAYRKIPIVKFSPLAGTSYRVLKAPGGTHTGKSPKIP
ncbi:hypothetical protein C8J57DRAFT_1246139 [Mycena rebaudengoi]|nr:hypothetical protein C8J57DRAFT_1246139 [Mycena rebaudengoi]